MKLVNIKDLSISALQLVTLLGLPDLYKEEDKALSRIRSAIQKLVVRAIRDDSLHDVMRSAVQLLAEGVKTLYKGSTGPLYDDPSLHLRLPRAEREKFWKELSSNVQALVPQPRLTREEEGARRIALPQKVRVQATLEDSRAARLASSVAMNSTWEVALSFVSATGAEWATAQNMDKLQQQLFEGLSSRQGRTQVGEKLATLWGRHGRTSVELADYVEVTVSLNRLLLQGNPVVQKMIRHPAAHISTKTTVTEVFGTLSAAVEPGSDVMEVAKKLLKDVEALARKRTRELDAAQKSRAAAAAKEAQAQLVEQLKSLPPHLRDALKKNPDLLKQV